ncbi:hypothetical protein B0E38_07901 [Streptomyces sp. 111WW2]|nr:hypothetical protein B0E38_07901 [Streptomyces sp. 111WW2]
MPVRWAPWPVKRNAVFPVCLVSRTAVCVVAPEASVRSPASSSSRSAPTTVARWSNCDRLTASESPMSAGAASGRDSTNDSSRCACPVTASGVRPDSTHGTAGSGAADTGSGCSGRPVGSGCSACSITTWALVPLMPKDETAARRGRPYVSHSRASVSSSTAPVSQSTCGDGASTCRVLGSTSWRIASIILMTLPTPAAAWLCPMLDLSEPRYRGRPSGRSRPYVASSAWASMGSPRVVPVPCASTASTSAGVRSALARAWRMTRSWEGPLGAVRPLEAPSWLTAEPRTTASTWWPLRRASESRSTSSRPTPSLQPVPSAAAANGLQRPSGDRPRCRENST